MARSRSPNRDKAFVIYKEHKGNITNREIANTLNEDEKVIAVWKSRDKWNKKVNVVQQLDERCTTKENKNTKTIEQEPITEEVKEVLTNTNLTDKQRLFCVIYSRCLNATRAYKKAYGCSYETAMVEGCKALRNPKISGQIEKLNAAQFNKEFIKKSLIQKYIDIAFADISDFVTFGRKEIEVGKDEDNNPVMMEVNYVDFKNSDEVDGTLISEVSQGKNGVSVKLQDKMKAMQWLSDRVDLLPSETILRLENEKAKVQIAREKLELEKQEKDNKDNTKPIEVLIKRKGED